MRREEDTEFEEVGLSQEQDEAPEREQEWMDERQAEPAPGEGAAGSAEHGVTASEQAEGESLDQRLWREHPDTGQVPWRPREGGTDVEQGAGPPADAAGRLIEEDEGAHTDTDKEMEARSATDTGDYSPEEEAVRLEEESGPETSRPEEE